MASESALYPLTQASIRAEFPNKFMNVKNLYCLSNLYLWTVSQGNTLQLHNDL